MHKKIEK